MNTNTLILSATLLLGSALPAAADQRPDHYVPTQRAVQVDEFLPQSGAAGSLVTVRGRGLRQVEYVLVGGYKATPQHNGGQELSFRIPQQHGDGVIELYVPGRGNVAVGRFTVFSMLGVEGFSPRSGRAGTEVEIHGQGFQHGDRVMMGDRQLTVQHLDASRIVVRIPGNASTDYLTVVRQGGVSERTAERFYVMANQPSISSVMPQSGLPGTVVRIAGEGFSQSCKVFYGQEKLPVLLYHGGSIEARIPDHAETDEYLYVNCAGEQGRSPVEFQLERQGGFAHIDDVQPRQGQPGTRVVLYGNRLKKIDSVLLHGMSLPIVTRLGNKVEVEIPHGAYSGNLAVQIRGRVQPTSFHFQVLQGAAIHSVSPGRVRAGSTVTLRGIGFDERTRLFWGQHELRVLSVAGNGKRIEALAPSRGMGTQYLSVDDGSGRVQTATSLEIVPQHRYTYRGEVHAGFAIGN
jgi:IPT/TIG domain